MFKFITNKPLWANILAALGLLVILIIIFFLSLQWITGYGKTEKVPSVVGQNAIAAQKILDHLARPDFGVNVIADVREPA